MTASAKLGAILFLAAAGARAQDATPPGPKPPDPLAHARLLMSQGQLAPAEAEVRAFLAGDEVSAPGRYLLARLLLAERKPADALQEFTRAARIEPPSSDDLLQVSRAYVLLNGYPDAQKWLERAVALNPANEEAWYSLGRVRYTNQQFTGALDAYAEALKLAPRDVRAENNRGLALDALNRTDDAVAAFRQAISWETPASPQREQPMVNLATVLVRKGDSESALPLLKQAEVIAPDVGSIREPIEEQLGHVYLQQGQLPEASEAFERALALSPKSAALHFLLGQTYRRMGDKAKADEEFKQSAALAGERSTPERN